MMPQMAHRARSPVRSASQPLDRLVVRDTDRPARLFHPAPALELAQGAGDHFPRVPGSTPGA